jgi:hypothetical protein
MGQVSIGPPLRIGGLSAAIVLLANMAVSFAIDSNDLSRWLLVPAIGAGAGIVAVLMAGAPKPELTPIEQAIRGIEPERRRRLPRLSMAGALVVVLVVIGGGGLVVGGAARYGMGWITGNERGSDRLVAPVTAHVGGLSLTVTRVEQTTHFTRVTVTVKNQSDIAVTMPIDGGNCQLIAGDGTTQKALAFRSEWNESLGQGAVRTGVVVFGGHLPADANRARVAFDHLFASSGSGPGSIVVANLQLLPG